MSFKENKTKYLVIFTVALDVIGMGIIMPILPEFVREFGASYLQTTLLVSIYALCSFLSAPLLGAISDRYGRKLVLVISIFGTALWWFVVGFAPVLWLVFVGRIIDGITAGNMVIAQTILWDIAKDEKERIANYGIFWAVFGIAFIIAPALGSSLMHFGMRVPIFFTGFLALANAISAYFILPETNINKRTEGKLQWHPFTPVIKAFKHAGLRTWYLVWTIVMFWLAAYQSAFALILDKYFHVGSKYSGYIFTIVGLAIAFNQAVLLRKFWLKRFHNRALIAITTVWLAIWFAIAGWTSSLIVLIIALIFTAFFQSTLRPVFQSEIIKHSDVRERGETNGILTALMNLGMGIWPIIAGYFMEWNITPFYLSAGVIGIWAIIALTVLEPTVDPEAVIEPDNTLEKAL